MPIFGQSPIWLGETTWVNRAVSPPNNARQFMSDVGPSGADMRWNSARGLWLPIGGALPIFDATIPVGIAPNGSMGNNGVATFTTALPAQFSGGYLYFPADKIAVGVAAGFYWVVPSSTTAATVYNNTYTPGGSLTRPSSPTAFVTTGPGAYTNTTAEITCHSFTLLGGLMGNNGRMLNSFFPSADNSATTKTVKIKAGATNIFAVTFTTSNVTNYYPAVEWANRGSQAANISTNWLAAGSGSTFYPPLLTAVDTSADLTITYTLQLSSTGCVLFDFAHVRVEPQ